MLVLIMTSVELIYLGELIIQMTHHLKIGLKILIYIVLQVHRLDSLDQCFLQDGLSQLFSFHAQLTSSGEKESTSLQ